MISRISPLNGRKPTRTELANFENGTVDDIICPDPWLLIVGINPGLWTAAVNAPFAAPSNRFWPSLHQSGLLPYRIDATAGLKPEDEAMVINNGIGLTNLVNRATAKASELSRVELAKGGERLRKVVGELRPDVVAVLGITAFRDAFDEPKAQLGQQFDDDASSRYLGTGELWVLPQPSGLNAHATMPVLVEWWKRVEARRKK
ncbi:mismatch-specific DNA-glycosylase [Arcanobacterium ihumii]|uniref:mismatch-specific DNA-glycosylase n=1 Tax=Arcanobacterium ihumii TaxID=2138162 RepID=UPI00190F3953|nr:mismatch-specific DNA-glycosylase [Arcanobacterium ihumii]